MKWNTLHELFMDQLMDLYNSEHQIYEALPKISSAATSLDLRKTLADHLQMTHHQVERLEEIFIKLGVDHNGKQCEGMHAILHETERCGVHKGDPTVKDCALISALQRVEHYEIAGFRSACNYAFELGYNDIADLLQETLNDEGETDKRLTSLARGGFFRPGVNEDAPK